MSELWQLGAAALARGIRAKDFTSVEVVDAHLQRIADVNPALRAVTLLCEDALDIAKRADRAMVAGAELGPLHGVPFTLKDSYDLVGTPTSNGVTAFKDNMPLFDAPMVASLKRAGAVCVARTNMPDLAFRWHTDSGLYGATKNPWDATRTPGGSSGGEAAALASGMSPLGVGGDYGGSLRWPALACGIAALRTTPGRIVEAPSLEPSSPNLTVQLFASNGPLARHVEDLDIAFGVMIEGDHRDPSWVAASHPVQSERPRPKVALTVDPGRPGVDPDVVSAVGSAGQMLREAGYEVVEVDPPKVAEAATLWLDLVGTEAEALLVPLMEQVSAPGGLQFAQDFIKAGRTLGRDEYIRGWIERHALMRAWSEFMGEYQLIVGPVSKAQIFPVGFDLGGVNNVNEIAHNHQLLLAVNALGLPAATVPIGVNAVGLPQGVQIIAQRWREDLCLDAAAAIEAAAGTFTPIDPR